MATSGLAVRTAMVCAAAVSGQFIAGKATRDALYLAHLDVTTLPAMVVATAACSIGLVALSSRSLRRVSPATFVPVAFLVSALLLLVEWALVGFAPRLAAPVVYLHISGLGPMLGSGFWLIATEHFDPRAARQHFGRIAGVGTLSGLASALVAERIAAAYGVAAILPVLSALNLICAWQIRRLALSSGSSTRLRDPASAGDHDQRIRRAILLGVDPALMADSPRSGMRALASAPYLRNLAALVLLGTVGATLVDYVFKLQAVETLGRGDDLLRFFAIYYAATSLLAFVIQTTSSTFALEKLGLAATTSTSSVALLVGGLGGIAFPGLAGATAARGGESIFRGSLFKTGYEIFYTPIPAVEKRAAKSIIDVGFDRLGDAVGGGLVVLLLLLPAVLQSRAILAAAVCLAAIALIVARRLNQGYLQTLERSLLHRAVELDLSDIQDLTTRTAVLRTLGPRMTAAHPPAPGSEGAAAGEPAPAGGDRATRADAATTADPELQDIVSLRSRGQERDRILAILRSDENLPATLVPHVIRLLAWDPVAEHAVRALRKVAEERVGELTDALLDPNQPFAVRRRLARVFSICVSQRAVDGLLLGLDDLRFEVRFQCGRSLAAVLEKNAFVRIDGTRVFDVVRREVAVSRPVWESHRLLDTVDEDQRSFVDEFLKDRAGQSLAHVFTLLSLVLPTTPLQIAYRGLHTDDAALRGTALEYLEGMLPADIRTRLWPFLGDRPDRRPTARPRDEILADLLRSNDSILMNLEELRRRSGAGA